VNALADILDERVGVARVKAGQACAEARNASGSTAAQAAADQALADLGHYVALRDRLDPARTGAYTERSGHSLFADLAADDTDPRARARIAAYRDEQRSVTGDYGGLVVPQYIVADLQNSGHSGSQLVDYLRRTLPPAGMDLTVPRVITAITAADQSPQNTAVAGSTPGTDDETAPVHTVSASFAVARQVLDRARDAELDILVAREGVVAVQALEERRVINGSGTAGQPTGILGAGARTVTLTGTDAASTLDAIAEGAAAIDATRESGATTVLMHPRRWRWLLAAGGDRSSAIAPSTGTAPVAGQVLGLDVVASTGVPITLGSSSDEDRVVVLRRADVLVADSPVRVMRQRDAATVSSQLAARILLDRYYASMVIDTAGVSVITGAGVRNPF